MTIDTTCKFRMMRNNYLELSFNSLTVSSSNGSFPQANIYDKIRSKPFYFAGRFEITASNNQLYFNDGSAKTATITVGEYTQTTLATEITTQMNAISSGFTCSYESTDLFKFANGSSFTLSLTSTTNAIWDTLGYSGAADLSGTAITADQVRAHYPFEYVKVDFGYNAQVDFVGMISSLENNFLIPESATVTIEANNIDEWTAPPLSVTPSLSTLGAFYFIDDVDSSYRWWRIKVENISQERNSLGLYDGIGHLYIGGVESLTTDNRNMSGGFGHASVDLSDMSESDTGRKFFNTRIKRQEIGSIQVGLLGTTDKNVLEQFYDDVGTHNPFFISIDPTIAITDDIKKLTRFVYFKDAPSFQHVFYNRFNCSFSLEECI